MSKTGGDDNEPKENDKCIAPPNSATGANDNGVGHCVEPEFTKKSKMTILQERMDSAKNVINKRHKLIIAILSVLIFILLLIVIVLAVSLGSVTKAEDICITSACLSAASSIVRSINASVDPCDDFWSFACGGWIAENPLPENRGAFSVRDQLEKRIYHDIRHYIDLIPMSAEDTSADFKVRKFYLSCMNDKYTDLHTFNNIIDTELGGWGVKNNFQKSKWDLESILVKLYSKYSVDVFFSVKVDTDDFHPQKNAIKITPSGLGLPHRDFYYNEDKYGDYVTAYRQLLVDVVMNLGSVISTSANKFAQDMISFEKRIAEITPAIEVMDNPYHFSEQTLKELRKESGRINWLPFFQSLYPSANLRDSTSINVESMNYFVELTRIIATTDDQTLNNYIIWRFVFSYLPYLPEDVKAVYNVFLKKMEGAEKNSLYKVERWEFCIRTTLKFLDEAVAALYYRNRKETESTAISEVQQMIDVIFSTLHVGIDSVRWIRSDAALSLIKQKAEEFSVASSIGIGYPDLAKNEKKLVDNHYGHYLPSAIFLNNIFEGYVSLRKLEQKRLLKLNNDGVNSSWNLKPTDIAAEYQYGGNQMTVAGGLFRYPFYGLNLPVAMKFGALGFEIGSEIMKFANSKGICYNPKGQLTGCGADVLIDTLLAQNNTQQCLINDMIDHPPKMKNFVVNGNLTVRQTFADVGGLQLIYDSYKKYSSLYKERGVLPGLSRSNDQLFFISMAQSMCEAVSPHYASAKYNYYRTLPSEQRVNTLFRQVKQFHAAFGCEVHEKECRVF